ncbi:MAG: hypothetical protein WA728_32740 [Xanthobacteraceae bacterium]
MKIDGFLTSAARFAATSSSESRKGTAAIAAMVVYIIGGFEYQPAAYITRLTINFFTTAFGFVTALDVILQQPVGPSAPESLQNTYHREGDP